MRPITFRMRPIERRPHEREEGGGIPDERGNPTRSEAIRGDQRQSEAVRGKSARRAEVRRGLVCNLGGRRLDEVSFAISEGGG